MAEHAPASESELAAPLPGGELGRVAYDTYRAAVGGKSVAGRALPGWDDQLASKPQVAAAWAAAALAVLTATFGRK